MKILAGELKRHLYSYHDKTVTELFTTVTTWRRYQVFQ